MGRIKDFMKKHEGVIYFMAGGIIAGTATYFGYKLGSTDTELRIARGLEKLEKAGYFSFLDPHKAEFITEEEACKLLKQDGIIK